MFVMCEEMFVYSQPRTVLGTYATAMKSQVCFLLGGMWGCHMQKKNARELWKESWRAILQDPSSVAKPRYEKGWDQAILARFVCA